jgi:DMSO/TMAO reductase YedYZ molybdopterin-dependent catalytic subunit
MRPLPQVDELTPGSAGEPEVPRRIGRGVFLGTVAGGLTSLWWGKALWSQISPSLSPVTSVLGPAAGWRIYSIAPTMPNFHPATWRLRIGGLVERPQELTYDQLRALPQASQVSDFHCVTGWSVTGVQWNGVRFRDLLAAAKPLPGAHALEVVSAERPYVDYLTFEQALLPDAMLAWEMGGKPLLREHGAPARVVIPELYGYKNVKWVQGINLVPRTSIGYWEQFGYDSDAWVGGKRPPALKELPPVHKFTS